MTRPFMVAIFRLSLNCKVKFLSHAFFVVGLIVRKRSTSRFVSDDWRGGGRIRVFIQSLEATKREPR